jgi:adenylate cyclase
MAEEGARQASGKLRRLLRQIGPARLVFMLLLLAAGLYVARYSWSLPLAGDAERALYDLRFTGAAEHTTAQDPRITLVTYTDETLRGLQKRSPLDRRMLAQALRALDQMNPKAIGIDILIDQAQAEDEELIATFRSMRTPVYLAFVTAQSNPGQMDYDQEQFLRSFLQQLEGSSVHASNIGLDTDGEDGVMRRWPEPRPELPPLLSNALTPGSGELAGYRGAIAFKVQDSAEVPRFAELPIETIATLGDDTLPPEAREPLMAELMPSLRPVVEGRYILIGGNISNADDFETPMSRQSSETMKGMVVHAHMLAQALDHNAPASLSVWMLWLAAIITVVAGALTGMLELRSVFLVIGLVVQLGLIAFLPFLLQQQGVDTITLPAAGWGAGWLLAFLGLGTAARAVGSEQRKFAHSALGKYLPADVANEIMRDPDRLKLTGEKKQIYAVFTDLEGFTKLSHAIEPEQLSTLLNRYLDTMSDTVLEYGGTIDKFVGDAVVAFWGAPISREDDADRATKAAVAMYECGEAFRRDAAADPSLPPIGVTRVGLHKGEAVVGNFGGEKRIQYTALGDGMNTAARLESANKALKTIILVSSEAMRDTNLDFFRPMGRIVLSGRSTPVEVWEPAPHVDPALRQELRDLWARYDGGDMEALTEVERIAGEHTSDAALQNFVFRIREAGPGRAFVLGSK